MTANIPNQVTFIDQYTIRYQRRFEVGVDRLWAAITRKPELDQWFMVTELALEEGGKYSFEGGWDGWISDLKPPHHLQFNNSDVSFTRFEIEVDETGCLFSLIDRLRPDATPPQNTADETTDGTETEQIEYNQPGGPGTHWTGVVAGWHCFVNSLERHLAGQPDEDDEYDQLCASYNVFLTRHYTNGSST